MKLKRMVAVILCMILLILPVNDCWAYYKNEHNIVVGESIYAGGPIYHGYWGFPEDQSILDVEFTGDVYFRGIAVGQTFSVWGSRGPGATVPSTIHIYNVYPKNGYFCTNTKYKINFFTIKAEVPEIIRMSPGMTIKHISSKRTELPPLNSITYEHSAKYLYTHSFEVICANEGENIIDYRDWIVDEQKPDFAYDYEPKPFTHRFSMPAKDHVYESRIIQEPTCDSKGEKKYTCNSCGAFKLEEIPAKGHNWQINQVDVEATCTNEGSAVYKCSNCGIMKTEVVPKLEHTWQSKYTLDIEPTCIEDGQKSIHCKVCDAVKEDSISRIKATGHNWNSGKILKASTCSEKGEKTYTCTVCGTVQNEKLPLTEHKEVKDTAVAATCETAGKTEGSHCSVCNKVIKAQTTVPALGHNWDSGKITKAATCTTAGTKTYTCTRCQKTKAEEIEAIGHKEVKDTAVAATCETAGKTEGSHCGICNTIIKEQKTIPALGHSWIKWKVVSKATISSPEKQERECERCHNKETRNKGEVLKAAIKVSASKITMQPQQKLTTLKVTYANGDSIKSWKSSNQNIFKVTGKSKGVCTLIAGKVSGKATLTIQLKSGLTKNISIIVKTIKTTKISGVKPSIILGVKKTTILKPVLVPKNSTEKIAYKSSNSKVATVNSAGKVVAKKKGTAYVYVKSGSKTVKCKIVVK